MTVVFWKIPYVDKTQKETETVWLNGKPIQRTTFKRCEHHLYIKTNDLSPQDKVLVEIALKSQELLGDISCFIRLRKLFQATRPPLQIGESYCAVKAHQYFENAAGEPISEKQFIEELLGLPPMITLHDNLHVPADLSEQDAMTLNIPELIPIQKENLFLTEAHIEILNRFVSGVLELQSSSLCSQYKAFELCLTDGPFALKQTVSEEQYKASLLSFRKLYMENEPANFKKAVKILQNKLLIQHPIITVINAENEKYDDILSKKVCMHSFGSMLFKDCLNPEVYPDGKTLINVVINVDCIHQGNAETRKTRNEVEQIISLEVMKFLVWSLLLQLLKPISIVARHAFYILKLLNAQNLTLPPRSISNAERKFFEYIENRAGDMAEILWNENNRNTPSISAYRPKAMRLIFDRLEIDKEKFEIFSKQ